MRHTGPSLELFPDEVSILVSKWPSLDKYISITQHNGTSDTFQLTENGMLIESKGTVVQYSPYYK